MPASRLIKAFREFVIGLTSFIKHKEVTGLFTATTASLMGGTSITEAHISTLADSMILLRYVEMFGEMKRGMTVLKMRGSVHDKRIREFRIDSEGMHLGARSGTSRESWRAFPPTSRPASSSGDGPS